MRIFFAGSEVSSWRRLMSDQHVPDVAMSFVGLRRRIKHTTRWGIADHYPDNMNVFLDSGAYSLNRDKIKGADDAISSEEYTEEDAMDIATAYMAFVVANISRVTMVSEFDAGILGQDWLRAMRDDFYDDLPEGKFMPIWHEHTGLDELERLASRYGRVGVLQSAVGGRDLTVILNSLVNRYGTRLHGVGMTKMDTMRDIKWDSVSSLSWISPSSFGDTQIWLGNDFKRYPRKYKDQCRKRHRQWIERNGFDAEKIIADDTNEVLRLALWSWQQFTASVSPRIADTPEDDDSGVADGTSTGTVDTLRSDVQKSPLVSRTPEKRQKVAIPGLGMSVLEAEDEDPEPVIEVSDATLLQCDTCFVKDLGCPGFRPHHECLYELPLEVKTTTQTAAVQDALIKIQTQRVFRMKMIEELSGGQADPNLSGEMDRLQRMIKAKSDTLRQGIDIHISGRGPVQSGPFSRYFGAEAAQAVTARPTVSVQELAVESGMVVDGEIVD